MRSHAQAAYSNSSLQQPTPLARAGTSLENPYVYDDAAREIKAMASQGLVEVVEERQADAPEALITYLSFRRLK